MPGNRPPLAHGPPDRIPRDSRGEGIGGVDFSFVALRAQELVYGHARCLPGNVPERYIHRRPVSIGNAPPRAEQAQAIPEPCSIGRVLPISSGFNVFKIGLK